MTTTWSDKQTAVFDDVENGKGNTVVLARAGCGKTTTILEALNRVPAGQKTLLVAFNKTIATEIQERLGDNARATVSTLHSYGLRTVGRTHKVYVDLRRGQSIADHAAAGESWPYRRALADAVGLAKGTLADDAESVTAALDAADKGAIPPSVQAHTDPETLFVGRILQCLDRAEKDFDGTLDFDDMVWLPHVLQLQPSKFDRVFVDETQDLNAAQLSLAKKAKKNLGRIVAVGDDRQAIYGFRGAGADAMGTLRTELSAKVLPLNITYRCPQTVVAMAQQYVPDFCAGPGAPEGIVRTGGVREAQPGDFVLSRTNAPLVAWALAFIRSGRKMIVRGRDFGAQLKSFVERTKAGDLPGLRVAVDKWEAAELERRAKTGRDTDAVTDRAATIHALAEGCASIADVLAACDALFSDARPDNAVIFSSTHRAKGLEANRVFVLQPTYLKVRRGQDCASVEEENLWYVAITRTKQELVLCPEMVT